MIKPTIIDKFFQYTLLKLIPVWVTPNHLTIVRFILTPFVILFLVNQQYKLAITIFILAALTDALDGARARTDNQITDWGKIFDPVADKLLIGTTAAIVVTISFGSFIAFIIIGLEVIILLSALYKKKYLNMSIEAGKAGKAKMIFQSIGISALMISLISDSLVWIDIATWSIYSGIFFALVSIFVYRSI